MGSFMRMGASPPGSDRTYAGCRRGIPLGRFLHNRAGSAAIVMYYILFGACWIFFSDLLVSRLATDTIVFGAISIIKGWLFIAVTSLLLYVLIKRRVRMVLELQLKHVGDIEERERRIRHANRMYAVLSSVNRSIIRISEQRELLNEICRIMVTTGGFKTAWIGWPNDDGWIVPEICSGDESGYLGSIRISVLDIPEGRGPSGTAIRERKPVVCNNIATNPTMTVWRELAAQNGFASSACFPFALPDGTIAGLTLYSPEPDFFCRDEEKLLLGEVADDMEYALNMLHTAAAHRIAEQRLKEIIDNSPAAIYAFDRDGYLLLANAAMASLSGKTSAELLGHCREEIGFSPESARLHRDNDLQVLAAGEPQVFEETNQQGDGMHTYLTVKFPLTAWNAGVSTVVAGISTDITERKRAEEELQKKNAEIEQFIYTVSHDLRSPLVTVKTFMGYLEKDMAEGNREQLAQDVQFIHNAADKMKLLLDELLEMSRIGRVETSPVMVSFLTVVGDALGDLAGVIKERNVEIMMPDTDLMLFGDHPRLCQIWQNLIENSIKFCHNGTVPRIEIGVQQASGEPVFFVKDNGIGIAPEYRAKIFGLFEKLNPKSPGAGLGLSMIQRVVEKYNGRIWVDPEGSETGTCFKFTLPGALHQE
jgi:PAS domain S-box-containing protein